MARIKIDIQGKFLGSVSLPVRITDINYGNHLGNDALVSLIHEARVSWLYTLGYTELNIEGASLIQGDLAVEYLNESFYGDVLTISLYASDISRVSFDLLYLVETNREEKTIPIAKAKTGLICFNYEHRKVMAVPANFLPVLQP